ncbi:MAG: hypothetical protein RL521_948 [Bacteroidota bacterium]
MHADHPVPSGRMSIRKADQWIGRSVNRISSELMTTSEKQSGMDVAPRKQGSVKFRLVNSMRKALVVSSEAKLSA